MMRVAREIVGKDVTTKMMRLAGGEYSCYLVLDTGSSTSSRCSLCGVAKIQAGLLVQSSERMEPTCMQPSEHAVSSPPQHAPRRAIGKPYTWSRCARIDIPCSTHPIVYQIKSLHVVLLAMRCGVDAKPEQCPKALNVTCSSIYMYRGRFTWNIPSYHEVQQRSRSRSAVLGIQPRLHLDGLGEWYISRSRSGLDNTSLDIH